MDTNDLVQRIDALEAEAIILRRYLRAIVSLLPDTQAVNAVFSATQRQINLDANSAHEGMSSALLKANAAFGVLQVTKLGHMKA